jgi:hypothetical protein
MVHSSQNISFELILVDNNGIQLKEEAGPPFLHQPSYALLCLLTSAGSLSGSLLYLPLIMIESISADYPLDLPAGDLFSIFLLIEKLQLLLAIVGILSASSTLSSLPE